MFKFSFCHDNCFYFKTLVPKRTEDENETLHNIEVMIYAEDGVSLHDFMTLEYILFKNQLGEVTKKDLDAGTYLGEYPTIVRSATKQYIKINNI